MTLAALSGLAILPTFGLLLVMFSVPPLRLAWTYLSDRRQSRHAVLRGLPLCSGLVLLEDALRRVDVRDRLLDCVVALRAALFSPAADSGLRAESELGQTHAVWRDEFGSTYSAEDLLPTPVGSAR